MICGGAKVYKDFLPKAQRMYLSRVEFEGEADTFFPEFNRDEWLLDKDVFHPEKPNQTPLRGHLKFFFENSRCLELPITHCLFDRGVC